MTTAVTWIFLVLRGLVYRFLFLLRCFVLVLSVGVRYFKVDQ